MSTHSRQVFLFPGQGAYRPQALRGLRETHQGVTGIIAEIDSAAGSVAGSRLSELLFDGPPRSVDDLLAGDTQALQLAIFGISMAVFSVRQGQAGPADVLMGHSLGEIAALTAAGAYSIQDGARIVAARTEALAGGRCRPGGMLAIGANTAVAAALARAVDDPMTAVAANNAPHQTVLSGPMDSLDRVHRAAGALGISSTPLKSPYAFHNPMLAAVVEPFRAAISGMTQHPLQRRVYSPILGRFYSDEDRIGDLLAGHLLRTVDFLDAVRLLHSQGHSVFVECGATDALIALVRRTVPDCQTLLGSASAPSAPPQAPAVEPSAAPAPVADAPPTRHGVIAHLRKMYASALDYPESVFTEDADLEADLGVDSVKQTELLARVSDHFGLSVLPEDFRMADLTTLADIAGLVMGADRATPPAPRGLSRDELLAQLRRTYATALDYPESVLGENADLEADLGVDSVKQTELLARVGEEYAPALLPQDFRLAELTTLGCIADFIGSSRAQVNGARLQETSAGVAR